jgi:hypothetical protein
MSVFRLDTATLKRRLNRIGRSFAANEFRPDVAKFAAATLQECIRITPVRSVSLIKRNQTKQFFDRQRYIRKNPGSATRTVDKNRFVEERAQARFLYKKSWLQCAQSARLNVRVSREVARSVTRRRNPVQQPPRGYAQWRGGSGALSLVIYNPFLEQPSNYKKFTGKEILVRSASRFKAQFTRDVNNRLRRAAYAAR